MTRDSMLHGPGGFATTRWSQVLGASAAPADTSHAALEELCRTYWPPVYAFVRRKTANVEEARDRTQAFFESFLEKRWYQAADPERGRFRGFLLTMITRFLANEHERANAAKRGGGATPFVIDTTGEVGSVQLSDDATPERAFERAWVTTLLQRVLDELRTEREAEGQAAAFDLLKPFLLAGADPPAYAQVASSLALSESGARVAVFRLRTRYRELLRAAIADTVQGPGEIDAELDALFAGLG